MRKVLFAFVIFIMFVMSGVVWAESNTDLKVMRVNHEGIVPYFNKDIHEYYLTVGMDVSSLEITAEADDESVTINVIGNNNLKDGLNELKIEVGTGNNKSVYYIYVTKTSNVEAANTNLEMLAVEDVMLVPEFSNDVSYYKADVELGKDALNILAVPESMKASVNIIGNENLKAGKNVVVINVIAENGFSFRRYYIDAFLENKNIPNEPYNAERLSATIETSGNSIINTIIVAFSFIIIAISIGVIYYKRTN